MSYYYLASPYSNYSMGVDIAYEHVIQAQGVLSSAGIASYSPIIQTHPVDKYLRQRGIVLDHATWLKLDAPLLAAAKALIILMLPGWRESKGVQWEIAEAKRLGKEIIDMVPGNIPWQIKAVGHEEEVGWDVCGPSTVHVTGDTDAVGHLLPRTFKEANKPRTFKEANKPGSWVENKLPVNSEERKGVPLATGCLDYFPDALAEVARLSKVGNDKHNPGEPLHWSRGKSDDHADCILRHMLDRGKVDDDGILHDAKVAWRALAQLQLALEKLK